MVKHTRTVAVSAPVKGMPVPAVERIAGLTTTMYDIVRNVVTPAMISRDTQLEGSGEEIRDGLASGRR